MASLSLDGIKRRIKGVKSLSKATKAMGLMASLKLPMALEKMERSEEFFTEVHNSLQDVSNSITGNYHPYTKKREIKKSCFVVLSGDRGFAAGYHSNLFKKLAEETEGTDASYFPIGKKAREYIRKKNLTVIDKAMNYQESMDKITMKQLRSIAVLLASQYKRAEWDELVIVYTHFHSVLNQTPSSLQVLPLIHEKDYEKKTSVLYEPTIDTVLNYLVPQFIFGLLYGAVTQSHASEIAARKVAMDTANKNASELIDYLYLQYNRLRQETITQELSEIVGSSKNKEG